LSIVYATALKTVNISNLNQDTDNLVNKHFSNANIKILLDEADKSVAYTMAFIDLLNDDMRIRMVDLLDTLLYIYCYNNPSNGIGVSSYFADEYISVLLMSNINKKIIDLADYSTLSSLIHGPRDVNMVNLTDASVSLALDEYNKQCNNRNEMRMAQFCTSGMLTLAELMCTKFVLSGIAIPFDFAFELHHIKSSFEDASAYQYIQKYNLEAMTTIFDHIKYFNKILTYTFTIKTEWGNYNLQNTTDIDRFTSIMRSDFAAIDNYYKQKCENSIFSTIPLIGGLIGLMGNLKIAESTGVLKNFMKSINVASPIGLTSTTKPTLRNTNVIIKYGFKTMDDVTIPDEVKDKFVNCSLQMYCYSGSWLYINRVSNQLPSQTIEWSVYSNTGLNTGMADFQELKKMYPVDAKCSYVLAVNLVHKLLNNSSTVSYSTADTVYKTFCFYTTIKYASFFKHAIMYARYASMVQINALNKKQYATIIWPAGKTKISYEKSATGVYFANVIASTLSEINNYIPTYGESPPLNKSSFCINKVVAATSAKYTLLTTLTDCNQDVVAYNVKMVIQTYLMFVIPTPFNINDTLYAQIARIIDASAKIEYFAYLNENYYTISALFA